MYLNEVLEEPQPQNIGYQWYQEKSKQTKEKQSNQLSLPQQGGC